MGALSHYLNFKYLQTKVTCNTYLLSTSFWSRNLPFGDASNKYLIAPLPEFPCVEKWMEKIHGNRWHAASVFLSNAVKMNNFQYFISSKFNTTKPTFPEASAAVSAVAFIKFLRQNHLLVFLSSIKTEKMTSFLAWLDEKNCTFCIMPWQKAENSL